jgi:hypothetical protein
MCVLTDSELIHCQELLTHYRTNILPSGANVDWSDKGKPKVKGASAAEKTKYNNFITLSDIELNKIEIHKMAVKFLKKYCKKHETDYSKTFDALRLKNYNFNKISYRNNPQAIIDFLEKNFDFVEVATVAKLEPVPLTISMEGISWDE